MKPKAATSETGASAPDTEAVIRARIPAQGRPILMRFRVENLAIEFRRSEHPNQTRVTVYCKKWKHPYRDIVALDWYDQRHRLARVIATRARLNIQVVETAIDACYDHWHHANRSGYRTVLLNGLPDAAPVECLIDPLLPIGATTILAGDGGVGKSACAVLLAQAWYAQIQAPLRASPLTELPLWHYYDWERINPSVFQWRCRQIQNGYHAHSPAKTNRPLLTEYGMFFQVEMNLFEFADRLYELIDSHRPRFIVIDSLSAAVPGSLNDEKVARDVMNLFAELGSLGCAVLAIAHVAKEEARTKARVGPFGSRMYYNLARQVLELTRKENAPHRYELHLTKNNYGALRADPIEFTLDWSTPSVGFR